MDNDIYFDCTSGVILLSGVIILCDLTVGIFTCPLKPILL